MTAQERQPADPITELAAASVQLHEWYTSLCAAGFTKTEAIALMGEILRPGTAS